LKCNGLTLHTSVNLPTKDSGLTLGRAAVRGAFIGAERFAHPCFGFVASRSGRSDGHRAGTLMLQQVTASPSAPPEYAIYKRSDQTKRPPEGGLSEEVRECAITRCSAPCSADPLGPWSMARPLGRLFLPCGLHREAFAIRDSALRGWHPKACMYFSPASGFGVS
jgi:hypothetical protein